MTQPQPPGAAPAAPRRITILLPHEPLCCPLGHKLSPHLWGIGENPQGGERCAYREPPGARRCGCCVAWWLLPNGSRLVVEVTDRELFEIQTERMNFERAREYLGFRWPRPRAA